MTTAAAPRSARVGVWLVWAVSAELLLLRMGTRTAVHIPGLSAIAGPLTVVSTAAKIAFTAAVVLALALLLLSMLETWQRGPLAKTAAVAVAVFLGGATATALGASVLVLDIVTLVAVVVVAPFAVGDRPRGRALWWWAAVVVVLVAAIPGLTEAAGTAGLGSVRPTWLAGPVELVAVVVALASPLLTGTTSSRRAAIVAVVTAAIVGAAFAFGPSTTEILVLWNFGLSGFLPAALYGLAAGCVAHTIVRLTEEGRGTEAAAVFLVIAGGVGLQSTYQSALMLCGLCLAGFAAVSEHRFTPRGEEGVTSARTGMPVEEAAVEDPPAGAVAGSVKTPS